MFSKIWTTKSTGTYSDNMAKLKEEIETADAILIGAGSGLSTAAGFTYSGKRFQRYFPDFIRKYGIRDIYSGGFYPFPSLEEYWGWWARHIYVNRYMDVENDVYTNLLELVKGKDYFVLTTNVDHQFQKTGFDKSRLFYTQGDYGLWQCKDSCHQETYDNEDAVIQMLLSTDFLEERDGTDLVTEPSRWKMAIDSRLIPCCPHCGKPMTMNLRCDDTFVQDEGWYEAAERYKTFLQEHQGKHVLLLELGVGGNTPGIIKYPFWQLTMKNSNAVYACLNLEDAYILPEIHNQSICISDDIVSVLAYLVDMEK